MRDIKIFSKNLLSALIFMLFVFQCTFVFGATVTQNKQWPFIWWDDADIYTELTQMI